MAKWLKGQVLYNFRIFTFRKPSPNDVQFDVRYLYNSFDVAIPNSDSVAALQNKFFEIVNLDDSKYSV